MFGLTQWRDTSPWRNDSPWVVGSINFDNIFKDFDKLFDTKSIISDSSITDEAKEIKIEVVAPGIDKSKLKLKLNDNVLTLSYKSEETTKSKFSKSSFTKKVNLPDNVDTDSIKAEYVDGIVTIKIPKTEALKSVSKNIQIN